MPKQLTPKQFLFMVLSFKLLPNVEIMLKNSKHNIKKVENYFSF